MTDQAAAPLMTRITAADGDGVSEILWGRASAAMVSPWDGRIKIHPDGSASYECWNDRDIGVRVELHGKRVTVTADPGKPIRAQTLVLDSDALYPQQQPDCCEHCGHKLQLLCGEELVEIGRSAPDDAPAHDAMCNDDLAWRCANVHCGYFAVEVEREYEVLTRLAVRAGCAQAAARFAREQHRESADRNLSFEVRRLDQSAVEHVVAD